VSNTDSTKASFGYTGDGTQVTLSLTFPRELLSQLVGPADAVAESSERGSDDDDELLFAEVVLRPLANLLGRAEQQ